MVRDPTLRLGIATLALCVYALAGCARPAEVRMEDRPVEVVIPTYVLPTVPAELYALPPAPRSIFHQDCPACPIWLDAKGAGELKLYIDSLHRSLKGWATWGRGLKND